MIAFVQHFFEVIEKSSNLPHKTWASVSDTGPRSRVQNFSRIFGKPVPQRLVYGTCSTTKYDRFY